MKHADKMLQSMRIRMVAPYIAPGSRVLDVGCADGALLRQVPSIGEYIGVDPDAPAEGSGPARFVRDTWPSAAKEVDGTVDIISALAVLEHVPPAEQGPFAAACAKTLRPGGLLLITVPSALVDPILEVLIKLRILDGMESEQHYGFSAKSTPEVFEPHGFELVAKKRFELGLNNMFVLKSTSAVA